MIVPQGSPLLVIDVCMPAAGCRTPLTLHPFPLDAIDGCQHARMYMRDC